MVRVDPQPSLGIFRTGGDGNEQEGEPGTDQTAGSDSELFIPTRLLLGQLPGALLEEYQFWQTATAMIGHATHVQDTPYRIEVSQENGKGAITRQRLLSHHGPPDPAAPILHLANLADVDPNSDIACLARYLMRLATRSHVLVC